MVTHSKNLSHKADVPDSGQLRVALVAPDGTDHISLKLHKGNRTSNAPIEQKTLASGERTILFEDLRSDSYYLETQASDIDGITQYSGQGLIYIMPESTNMLTVLFDWGRSLYDHNITPMIASVAIANRTVLATEVKKGKVPNLFLAPGDANKPVTFTATITGDNPNPFSMLWTVKEGPREKDADVGTITASHNGQSITWAHAGEGKYYVHILATDGRGWWDAFMFAITTTI
jgi:hypothetical protein